MEWTGRRHSRTVRVGNRMIGGENALCVQSMTNIDPRNKEETLAQVRALTAAGCEIVRLAVVDAESTDIFRFLKAAGVTVPLVADIHFDYRIALAALEAGADKIRINPGNIGSKQKVQTVAHACRERGVPIRIGVNSGSLEKDILTRYGAPCAEALAESALYHARLLEEVGFDDIILSAKASDTRTMIGANRILAQKTNYPLHLGVTEAGSGDEALIKSSIGIGTLLAEGIGDTLRVSLTDDPVQQVTAARTMLRTLGLCDEGGMSIISCPTCGRTRIDLISLTRAFRLRVKEEGLDQKNLKVALMGCVVNGPGEAAEADIGIAGGKGEALLFAHGKILRKVREADILDELIREIRTL